MNLTTIRKNIDSINKELRLVEKAVPPVEYQEERLRSQLTEMANAKARLIQFAADALNGGQLELTPPAPLVAEHGFGLAVQAIGVDQIIEEAKRLAASKDNGALRLTPSEQFDRLNTLRRERYALELEEEKVRGSASRRADVTPAAVLGLPVDEAEDGGFLSAKV